MKRSDIGGFSVRLFGYSLEVVTVHGWPCVLALSTAGKTLWRVEI
jgi:hypothetical protein